MNASPGQPQQIHATARESALYQAGYEAGKAQALQEMAADLGAAGAALQAAETTSKNLRDGAADIYLFLQATEIIKAKARTKVRDNIEQVRALCENLRASMSVASSQAQAAAKLANEKGIQARKAFAEQVAQAQQLGPRPGLLKRLIRALKDPS